MIEIQSLVKKVGGPWFCGFHYSPGGRGAGSIVSLATLFSDFATLRLFSGLSRSSGQATKLHNPDPKGGRVY